MKKIGLCLMASLLAMVVCAAGSESFEKIGKKYYEVTTINYTGDNGQSWTIVGTSDYSTAGTYGAALWAYDAKGNRVTGNMSAAEKAAGVGRVTFVAKACYASTKSCWGPRSFKVKVGSVEKIVTESITLANKNTTYNVDFDLTGDEISSSVIEIQLIGVVSGEPAFCVDELSWTSCSGKPKTPTITVDSYQDQITHFYWGESVTMAFASETEGVTFYYTTNGSDPTTSSSHGNSVSLPMDATTTVKVGAYVASMGMSEIASMTVTTCKGQVNANPFTEALREGWECVSGTATLNKTTSKAENTTSGLPVLSMGGKNGKVVTEAYICPRAFSYFMGGTAKTRMYVSYQLGTYEIKDGVRTWVSSNDSWTQIGVARMKAGDMVRYDCAIPTAIQDKVVRIELNDSVSTLVDDVTMVSAPYTQVATPTISRASGEVTQGTTVTITAEAGATIYYTLNNGTTQVYTNAIVLNSNTELRAWATKNGCVNSWTARADYVVTGSVTKLNAPTYSVASGNINWGSKVSIQCGDDETLHYRINGGSEQTHTGTVEVTVTGDKNAQYTISAYVSREGYADSDNAAIAYTIIYPQLSSPTISPEAGAVAYGTKVTISGKTGELVWYKEGDGAWGSQLNSHSVTIYDNVTIYAYVTKEGCTASTQVSATYTVQKEKYPTPTFNVASGEVAIGTQVTINAGSGATLTYTVNGVQQTTTGMIIITIEGDTEISAYAIKDGYLQSDVASATYTVAHTPKPTFDVTEGQVDYNTTVIISAALPNDTLYYRIDNNAWQKAQGSAEVTVNASMTISAYAAREAAINSEVVEQTYWVQTCEEAEFSISGGEVTAGTTVQITFESGATLHYTINNGAEQTSNTIVTLTINENINVETWVTREGYAPSNNVNASFVIKDTPTGMDDVDVNVDVYKKVLRNGRVMIVRDGVEYDVMGNSRSATRSHESIPLR